MKRLLLILLLISSPLSAAELANLYVTEIKNFKNANAAMIFFNDEKVLASQYLNVYEPAYQTIIKEKRDGTFDVRYIFYKRKDK